MEYAEESGRIFRIRAGRSKGYDTCYTEIDINHCAGLLFYSDSVFFEAEGAQFKVYAAVAGGGAVMGVLVVMRIF